MYAALYAPGNLPILIDCAKQFSPLIEITSPDLVIFDIRGLGRRIGTSEQIARAIGRTIGIPSQLAIASNPDTASYLARSLPGITVVARGQEEQHLAPLSLLHLGCPSELGEVLSVWGVHTFGEFAQLPPLGVAARLGEEGTYWQNQCRGSYHRQLRIINENVRFYQEQDFEDSVINLEPLLFLIGRWLFELCLELKARFLATNEVRLELELDEQPEHTLRLRLSVPIQQHKTVLKLVQLELEQQPPPAPIRKLKLELIPVPPKTTQEEFFTAAYPAPEQLELTLARVRQIVGAESVGTPELANSHKPDDFVMHPFVASARKSAKESTEQSSLAFRRFRPAIAAQVKVAQQPTFVTCRVVQGQVCSARGPWFTSGQWWTKDIWNREEWDVAFPNNTLFRIFRDLNTNAWFVEGNYD
jgi:protein ImuB